MENIDLCSQVLFKKYTTEHPLLSYADLRRIVEKFCKDPIYNNFEGSMTTEMVRTIHTKVYPVIEKIHLVKSVRSLNVDTKSAVAPKITEEETPKISHDTLTPSLNYKVHYVLIDSKDRNKDRWPNTNPFQFNLGPSSVNLTSSDQHNSVYRSFADVHAITVKKIILPQNLIRHPYLLLVINELGPNVNGTNDEMNTAYGHLTNPSIIGDYAHFTYDESFESVIEMGRTTHMTKIFTPRIEVSKLTFCIQTPDGSVLQLTDAEQSIVIELQIICLKKELENTMLLRPG